MAVLVVGGAGYIGSHVCKALAQQGKAPVVYDNLSSGHGWAVKWGPFFEGDILDAKQLEKALLLYKIEAVIHLASYTDVRASKKEPSKYYENNLVGTLALLQMLCAHGIKKLIFSSSAAVYGAPLGTPISESHPKAPINPYGKIKWAIESLLEDFYDAYGLSSVSLRYFNAAGADLEKEIGEAHTPETHLIPRVLLAALKKEPLSIFGDGSAVRDFIHVADLAEAHVKALDLLEKEKGALAFNLGTGKGVSVAEILRLAESVTGAKIPYTALPARIEEPAILVADSQLAKKRLGWAASHSSLETILSSAWSWHQFWEPA